MIDGKAGPPRCPGKGARIGLWRVKLRTTVRSWPAAASSSSVAPCLELLELQLELVEQLATALCGLPKALASQFGDDQLQMRVHRLGTRGAGFCRSNAW
jgi:hypothetical protein